MLKLLIDQNFNHRILRGLQQRVPGLDAVTAFEVGLGAALDSEVLEWATAQERILLTHDRKTIPREVAQRTQEGKRSSGVVLVPAAMPVRQAIGELELTVLCCSSTELLDRVLFLPL